MGQAETKGETGTRGQKPEVRRQRREDSRKPDKVQSSIFKVPSFLINRRRIFKLETLNFKL
jgi:hypothetical protein